MWKLKLREIDNLPELQMVRKNIAFMKRECNSMKRNTHRTKGKFLGIQNMLIVMKNSVEVLIDKAENIFSTVEQKDK